MGYGTTALDEYIFHIQKENKKVEIVLHTLEKAKKFYFEYGFF